MAKKLGVQRSLVVPGKWDAAGGARAQAFAAGVLGRTRQRTQRGGAALFFVRRRRRQLQIVQQRWDFSFAILVNQVAWCANPQVYRSQVVRREWTAGRNTLWRVAAGARALPLAELARSSVQGRLPTGTAPVHGVGMRLTSSVIVTGRHFPAGPVLPSAGFPWRSSERQKVVFPRPTFGREAAQDATVAGSQAVNSFAGTSLLFPGILSQARQRLRGEPATRPTPVAPAISSRRPRPFSGPRIIAETFHFARRFFPFTTIPERRVAARSDRPAVATTPFPVTANRAEFAGLAPIRRLIALTERQRLVPQTASRPLRAPGRASSPPMFVPVHRRSALQPPSASDRPPSAAAVATPQLRYALPGQAESPLTSPANTAGGTGTMRLDQPASGHAELVSAASPSRAAFSFKSASPQELQSLSQRVYELIVDRVRREKERFGR